MDIHCSLDGIDFVWDETKADNNLVKHDGISFEQAATVFFDPLFRLVDAEPPIPKGTIMSISETLKARLSKDRPMTSITLRIPVDVVDSMKSIAPKRGFAGYQTLLKAYLSDGLRQDEAKYASSAQTRLLEALKRHGIPQEVLDEAAREIAETV